MSRGRLSQGAVVVGLVILPWLAVVAADKSAGPPSKADKRPQQELRRKMRERMLQQNQQRPAADNSKKPGAVAEASPRITPAAPGSASGPRGKSRANADQFSPPDAHLTAAQVDRVIQADLHKAGVSAAAMTTDEDFLHRVSLDLAGVPPTTQEVLQFKQDASADKRAKAIDRLLETPEYAANWGRYWRDVIFSRATEMRVNQARRPFEDWITEQLRANRHWDQIVTALLTATGDVTEKGETALIFAQGGEPDEVAAETSRIFLGIQLQCANCHDHPSDSWKREQFHGLAAFFPRLEVRRKPPEMRPKPGDPPAPPQPFQVVSFNPETTRTPGEALERMQANAEQMIRRLDRNGDRKISRDESKEGPGQGRLFERLFEVGDTDKDGLLSVAEIKKVPPPPMMGRRGSDEYYMPDLQDPQSRGTKFDPKFFLGDLSPGKGLSDEQRRTHLAQYITSPDNPWFAKAFVNRMWAQLLGEGFYMPIDDMGPERTASSPAALEELAHGFTATGYDIKWLLRAIANTETYQRTIQPRDPQQTSPTFAAPQPVRLRGDQLYSAITTALGVEELGGPGPFRGRGPMMMMGGPQGLRSPRGNFNRDFGFDPSTPPDEVLGTLPQALFFMNSPVLNRMIRGAGPTQLARILETHSDNDAAVRELYLQVHAREPSARELEICREYLGKVGSRREGFEDLQWGLLNSTEFLTKR